MTCYHTVQYKGRNPLTGIDRDIFGWFTLNNCSVTSCQTLYLYNPLVLFDTLMRRAWWQDGD